MPRLVTGDAPRFALEGTPVAERFELMLLRLRTPTGAFDVPVVDGWIELQMALLRVPDAAESRAFFAALDGLCTELRQSRAAMRWYFLHKPPGLKLRFKLGVPDAAVLGALFETVLGWRFGWIEADALGSVFDQAELLPALFRDDVERLLTRAADGHVAAVLADRRGSEEGWADFLAMLLVELGLDGWLAHQALARLRRLRSAPLAARAAAGPPLFDPSSLLAEPLAPVSPGFTASVALLQAINLMFNLWAVDAAAQARILDRAIAGTRPSLLSAVDG